MALFYADSINPMMDYPTAMHYASDAESLFVSILEDRDKYKEAKRLIKRNITIQLVRETKRNIILRARQLMASDAPITDAQLDSYATAFSADSYTMRLIESKRLQTKYQQALESNTLAAYRSFIETYGSTQEGEDARAKMNSLASSIVEKAHSEAEVDKMLEGYLDIESVRDAATRRKSAIAYDAVMAHPTPQAYRDYLSKYPGSDGYSSVLAKMDQLLEQEFEQMHSARQFADFAIENPDNPLADEAMSRLKKLITEERDMDALHIYLSEFPLDISYNDIYLQVFNWHTEEGNLAPIEMFEQHFPDFPYKMALQDAKKAARKYDSIEIPRLFTEKDFSYWASKVYHLTGKKESYVALQRTLSNLIASKQWNKALERIEFFTLSFEDNCVDEVAELRSILESPVDNRMTLTPIVRPAYDFMHPVLHPDGNKLFFNREIAGQYHIQIATPTTGKKGAVWRSSGDIVFSNIENRGIEIFSLFDNGKKMLLGKGGDILVAEFNSNNDTWNVIETLPAQINMPSSKEFDAFMLPDGSGMLFASDRPGGHNLQPSYSFFHGDHAVASDIYFAPIEKGQWGQPVNLGISINSPYMECSPVISDDLKTLYFITDGHGLGFGDIYYATRDNVNEWTSWSEPVNYGKEVNTGFDEKSITMASSLGSLIICSNAAANTNGKSISDEASQHHYGCYSAPLYHTINADFTRVEIRAENVGFTADIVEVSSYKNVGHTLSVKQQSSWNGLLRTNQPYLVYAYQPGFFIPAMIFTPSENATLTPKVYSVISLLALADEGHTLPLKGILFHDGRSTLESCSSMEIDHLADFLLNNEDVGAELSCNVAGFDDAACFRLSQERADRVKQELVARGIHPDRLATSPYGNSQTKNGYAKTSITLTLHRLD